MLLKTKATTMKVQWFDLRESVVFKSNSMIWGLHGRVIIVIDKQITAVRFSNFTLDYKKFTCGETAQLCNGRSVDPRLRLYSTVKVAKVTEWPLLLTSLKKSRILLLWTFMRIIIIFCYNITVHVAAKKCCVLQSTHVRNIVSNYIQCMKGYNNVTL